MVVLVPECATNAPRMRHEYAMPWLAQGVSGAGLEIFHGAFFISAFLIVGIRSGQ
jgi:hypothetical protein